MSVQFASVYLFLSASKSIMSVPCSDQDFRPMKSKVVPLPAGVRAERCWCGHLAKVKESVDFSDKMGMKFFMCANTNASPTRGATTSLERPSVCSVHFCDTIDIFSNYFGVFINFAISVAVSSHMHVVSLD